MAIGTFGYIPPHKSWSRGAAVTGTASATDYLLSWLCDERSAFPLRISGVTGAWTITAASGTISAIMLANHRVKVNAVLSAGIVGTIVPATAPVHDILLNPWLRITPVAGVTAFTITITTNTESIIIGELIAGELLELPLPMWQKHGIDYIDYDSNEDYELNGILNYDEMAESRVWKGAQIYTTTQMNALLQWQQAQRTRSRPSMIVPDTSVNDAFMGFIKIDTIQSGGKNGLYQVGFRIQECPRTRW